MRTAFLAVLFATGLGGCAGGSEPAAPGASYEPREARTGSNIPSRDRRAPTTPEDRERARAEAEAIRDSQIRTNSPKSNGQP